MTIPPAPPVPAARTVPPPRGNGAGAPGPAAGEFTDLVREQLQSEKARRRTGPGDDPTAAPGQAVDPSTAGAPSAPVPVIPAALAGLAVTQPVDPRGAAPVDEASSGVAVRGARPADQAPGTLAATGVPTAAAANASPAGDPPSTGSPLTGPHGATSSGVAAAASDASPGSSTPFPQSPLAADLGPASGSASVPLSESPADRSASSTDAGEGTAPFDVPGAAGPVAAALSGNSAPTASTSTNAVNDASPVLDQAFPVVNRLVSRGDGTHRMTLKLYPVELGEIQLTVTVRGDRVDVTFAAGPRARDALRDGAAQLRGLLELTGRTTGHLLVRDLPGAVQSTPLQAVNHPSSAAAGTPLGDTGAGGGQWQEPGRDPTGPGGSGTDRGPAGTQRVPPVSTPTAAPAGPTGSATALDVRI